MTYGNFVGGYRPHLDSADFIKALRRVVCCAFLLAVVFSVKGASSGMRIVLNTNLLLAVAIAAGLTATAASLAFSSFVFDFSRGYRWGFRVVAGVIFVCLSALNYLGFAQAEEQGKADAVLVHPEVVAYDKDISDLVNRQNQYGIAPAEKQSLLAREREARRAKQELIDRLRHEKAVNPTVAARALGENEMAVRVILATSPDVMIMVLLPLLAQLLGAVGMPLHKGENQQTEKQVVYVPMSQRNGISSEVLQSDKTQPNTNGKLEPASSAVNRPTTVGQQGWFPFGS